MTAAQDIHVDLMHVLYVYSRVTGVWGRGSGVVITKHSKGAGVCMWYTLGIYKTHIVQSYIIEVQADMYIECRGIYTYETRGVWGHAPQGKFEFLFSIMLDLRPF